MVKTKTPLFSAEASGTFADRLTFLQTRRGTTIRKRVRPRDPKTGGQIGRRSAFDFISKNWSTLSAADVATWSTLAAYYELSTYNTYTRDNLQAWHGFLPPTKTYPPAAVQNNGLMSVPPFATAIGTRIELNAYQNPVWGTWGIIYFASLSTGFATDVANAIAFVWTRQLGYHPWTWSPPNAGPWFFNARLFTTDGKLEPEDGQFVLP